jgi:hypothetical protein
MERHDVARGGARGGEDVPAARTAGARVAASIGAIAGAGSLAALTLNRVENEILLVVGWRVAAFALLALVAALTLGWSSLLTLALLALGGLFGVELVVDEEPLDAAAPLVAAALVVTAELGYWSLEEREPVATEPGEAFRRLAHIALVALGTLAASAVLLALVDSARTSGLAIDLLGTAAAVATVVTIVVIARRQAT